MRYEIVGGYSVVSSTNTNSVSGIGSLHQQGQYVTGDYCTESTKFRREILGEEVIDNVLDDPSAAYEGLRRNGLWFIVGLVGMGTWGWMIDTLKGDK